MKGFDSPSNGATHKDNTGFVMVMVWVIFGRDMVVPISIGWARDGRAAISVTGADVMIVYATPLLAIFCLDTHIHTQTHTH